MSQKLNKHLICSPPRSAGRLASRLSSTPHHLQQGMTLAFLENQLASTLTLQSAQEYRYWLLIYARFLVNEGTQLSLSRPSVGGPRRPRVTRGLTVTLLSPPGSEYRLRELCKELLGPVHKSAATSWEATTLVRHPDVSLPPSCKIIQQGVNICRFCYTDCVTSPACTSEFWNLNHWRICGRRNQSNALR